MTVGQLRELLVKAAARFNEDNATRLAAAFSFYAVLALAPLLVFAVALASHFLDQGELHAQIITQAKEQLGRGAADLVTSMIQQANKPGASIIASIVSLVLALIAASGLFDQLDAAVSSIWKISAKKGNLVQTFLLKKIVAITMALIFVALIFVWMALDSVISYWRAHTGLSPAWHLVSFGVSVAFLSVVFAIAFKGLPRGMVQWRDVWIPACVTAFGFGLSKYLLSLYFAYSNVGLAYGPAGALVVILLWLYYSSQIFFFGVELVFAFAYEFGSHKTELAGELEFS